MLNITYKEDDRVQVVIRDNGEPLVYLPGFLAAHHSTIQLKVGAAYTAKVF